MKKNSRQVLQNLSVLSIHWGFSLGGIGKYVALIESVSDHAPVRIKSVCILGRGWQTDLLTLHKIDVKKIFIQSRFDFSWLPELSALIKQISPDLIMTHGFNGHFVAFVSRLVSGRKIPVVCSYHGLYHPTSFTRKFVGCFFNLFNNFFLRHVALEVLCVAGFTRDYLIKKGVDSGKLTIIHNGIEERVPDTSKRHELRQAWGVTEEELLLGAASRLDPVKGLEYLIDAMRSVKDSVPHAKLVIIGTGSQEQQLKNQAARLGLDSSVIFTGFRTDIDQCLGAIDIFMLPSLAECHSIAILEAMRAGKPIIATEVGGNTESIRHMQEAVIGPPKNAESIAKAIELMAGNPALREKLGENARKRFLEHFTVETMVKKTADWLLACGEKARKQKSLGKL